MDDGVQLLRRRLAAYPGDLGLQAALVAARCRAGECKKTYDQQGNELVWTQRNGVWGRSEKTFAVTLRDAPLADLIAAGRYDWINSDVNDRNFTIEDDTGTRQLELIQFEAIVVTSEQIEAWLLANQYRSATLKELLALSEHHPDEQRRVLIAALGSRCSLNLGEYVPMLGQSCNERGLGTRNPQLPWSSAYHFLAVRI